ncbi:hypothetical protein Tco_0625148 [Tanacetum coccineum]|uniref:Uncharacterized protein n=1 Tax=Tanacetum coccineum TaxID=301880 RepID=A0ABQ4WFZ7_9ASTR
MRSKRYQRPDTSVPSQQELDLLFGPLYDEFFNDGTSRINKSSSPTDNSIQKDTLPSMHIQPPSEPSTPTNVHAEENNDNQAEFTNPFCTPVQENAESSSCNIAFLDADHAGCIDTRKSTSRDIQFLGDKLVSWMSKKQNCTAMSSAEAEYVALSASCTFHDKTFLLKTTIRTQAVDKSPTHYPCDSAKTFRVILFSIRNDEWKSFQCHHQTALRIHKGGLWDGDASFQLRSDSLPHAHAQTTKTYYKHQDSRIKKAQDLKTKTSAQTLIYKIFLQDIKSIKGDY